MFKLNARNVVVLTDKEAVYATGRNAKELAYGIDVAQTEQINGGRQIPSTQTGEGCHTQTVNTYTCVPPTTVG